MHLIWLRTDLRLHDNTALAAASQRGNALGLNDDELAFYDALSNNEASVRELGQLTGVATPYTDALLGLARLHAQVRELY